MIKVGQIYRNYVIDTVYVISNMINGISAIFIDGSCGRIVEMCIKESVLIAEYPTWQEAVNSKDFNNDRYI